MALDTTVPLRVLLQIYTPVAGNHMSYTTNWLAEVQNVIAAATFGNQPLAQYAKTNLGICQDIVSGRALYSGDQDDESGAKMVVKISSAHVPAFCEASRKGDNKPYKNGYDLGWFGIGSPGPKPSLRELVDAALPLSNQKPENVYFGAVELTGSGIRFYGDVCLVLRRSAIDPDTLVLDRNSFDLISEPLRNIINNQPEGPARNRARASEAEKLAGNWKTDTGTIAALKALQTMSFRQRRFTSGQIAEAIRHDEDYIEIIKQDSFGTDALEEGRLSAADAAYDALTAERDARGPTPRLEALEWRQRRRVAEEGLRAAGVPVRVVTTSGRSRD
jgi:hypothetical protein